MVSFKCNPALFFSETIQTCIVNPSYTTCPQTRSKSSDKIHQIHPPQRKKSTSTTLKPMNMPASPSKRKKKKHPQQHHMRIPFFITNLSSMSRVVLPKDHIVAFITPENPEMNYIEITKVQSVEEQCRNWKHPTKMLPKVQESDFLVSLGDIKEVRRCMLPKTDISDETHESFHQLLNTYQAAFFTSSEDIGPQWTHYYGHWYRSQLACVPKALHTSHWNIMTGSRKK